MELVNTYRSLTKKAKSACRLIMTQVEQQSEGFQQEMNQLLAETVGNSGPLSLVAVGMRYTEKELTGLKVQAMKLNSALQRLCQAVLANCRNEMEFVDVDIDERVSEDVRPLLMALKLLESLGIVDFGLDSDSDTIENETHEPKDLIEQFEEKPQLTTPEDMFLARVLEWGYIAVSDEYRVPVGYSKGGIPLTDEVALRKLRNVGKEIIKRMGKKILRGDLNLTTISFPIACMMPNSALHNCLRSCMMLPMYLGRAAQVQDPIERLKLAVVGTISSFVHTSTFLKPLNPILGETLTASFEDGMQLFSEQTFHHPPISHVLLLGPKNLYRAYGYYQFASKAHLNSVSVTTTQIINSGHRTIEFANGQKIVHTFPEELYSGTFLGTLRHESLGNLEFKDEANQLHCVVKISGVKGKPSDYVDGTITHRGQVVSKMRGTYLGFFEFDGVRYWDHRYVPPSNVPFTQVKFHRVLPSDSEFREDLILLRDGDIDKAQLAKERLEEVQRHDRKLKH